MIPCGGRFNAHEFYLSCYLHCSLNLASFTLISQGKKILVIGTTSELNFLDSVGLQDAFSVTYNVPTLKTEDAKKVCYIYLVRFFFHFVWICLL